MLKHMFAVAVIVSGMSFISPASAQAPALGSAQFKPSAEQPVGWRGDWTGRFPGATPPLAWSRRVSGITSGVVYQAKKPAGEVVGADAHPLEYFTIKDWLVIGPFDAADPAKDIDKDFLNGEAAAQPDDGQKVGELAWKTLHVGMDTQSGHAHNGGICRNLNIDFVYLFGKFVQSADPKNNNDAHTKVEGDFTNKLAYAHTYLYSPTGGPAGLRITYVGAACRAWLNGQPVTLDKNADAKVELKKGWNRLLVKLSCAKGTGPDNGYTSLWRFAAYLTPAGPVSYETKNVAWMTRVTGRSMSQPIVVGDLIFLGANISDLMCLNKADGKVQWIRSNTPWDALSAEEQGQYKDKIEPLVTKLNQANDEMVAAINAMVSPQGMNSAQQAEIDKKLKAKTDLEQSIHKAFEAIDKKRFVPLTGNEVTPSNATPCSDGKRVYWACGGGMKGPGATVISCFDLTGKRVWTYHEPFGAPEHGVHSSPCLADGKLVYGAQKTLIALDSATGQVAWKQKLPGGEISGNSPQAVRIGEEHAILTHHSYLFRASDGSLMGSQTFLTFGDITPVVENGVLYNPDKFANWGDYNVNFIAVRLPASPGAKFTVARELKHKDTHVPLRGISYFVASPLYVDGIVYSVDMSGGLSAVDVNEFTSLYRLWLDGYNRFDRYLYGVSASPTLGGRGIYLVDDAGYTIIIQPGAQYKELGRNVLENISLSSNAGNPCRQEAFYTAPWFEGNSMYLRGEEYLYCVRGDAPRGR